MNKRYNRKIRRLLPLLNFIEYALLRLIIELINLFPVTISTWVARRIGEVLFLLLPGRRRIALENLSIAFGNSKSAAEKFQLALESFRHLATCIIEFFRVPKFVKVAKNFVSFKGFEHLQQALTRGKGAILVMSHLGPWEYLAFLHYLKGIFCTALVRPIKNPYIYRHFKYLRKLVRLQYNDKDSGPRMMLSELKQNHLVAVAIDQWAGNDGLWIDFFGQPTSCTSLPARLARKTGCALVPAFPIRTACGRYQMQIEPEVPIRGEANRAVEEVTKELNRILEQKICLYPEQWMWTHKRWKGTKK